MAGLNSRKVLLGLLWVRLHGDITWLPACWAHLVRVLLDILYSLQCAECLFNTSAKGQVVDGGMLNHSLQMKKINLVEVKIAQ